MDLKRQVLANPQVALELADELWQDEYFEVLQVAIFILGNVPVEDPDQIVKRIKEWLSAEIDPLLASQLFSVGTQSLQPHFHEAWESLIHGYLSDKDPKKVNYGLIGLIQGLKSPSFSNLPAVFRLTSPFLQEPSPEIMRSLEKLIKTLAEQSPIETMVFLKQAISISESPDTIRLVKNAIQTFPEDLQQEIKAALKH